MKKKTETKGKGAPAKLTGNVLTAINKVIDENILICTDEELVIEINNELPEDERFTYEAFSKWKRGLSQINNPYYPEFLRLIKKALIREKKRLLNLLEKDDKQWQRFAWILERKFDEWNIKTKSEIDHNVTIPQLPTVIVKRHSNAD